jgi:hypothetical protein
VMVSPGRKSQEKILNVWLKLWELLLFQTLNSLLELI